MGIHRAPSLTEAWHKAQVKLVIASWTIIVLANGDIEHAFWFGGNVNSLSKIWEGRCMFCRDMPAQKCLRMVKKI